MNSRASYRKGEYFRNEYPMTNAASSVYQSLTNLAVLNNGTNADITTTNVGKMFMPKTPETFAYDYDGNLTTDGRWTYVWDAENRLVQMISTNVTDFAKSKLQFTYDYQGRRAEKKVSIWTNANWVVSYDNHTAYDGWNLLAELSATNNVLIKGFMWGLDMSGSLQGAGGVGGLLAFTSAGNGVQLAAFDGNGNVNALVAGANGTNTATYEYSPFGQLIRSSGFMANINPFRFSTKYDDNESGFLYYGLRYADNSTAKWLSRDPIGEMGGRGLHGYCNNDVINSIDSLGLKWVVQRSGGARAIVYATSVLDNLNGLASRVGLDPREYKHWLSPAPDKVSPCDTYTVPNNVYIVIGYFSFWGIDNIPVQNAAAYGSSVLGNKGFRVTVMDRHNQTFHPQDVTSHVDSDLWGFAFFGHGEIVPANIDLSGDFVLMKHPFGPDEKISSLDMQNIPALRYTYGFVSAYMCAAPYGGWSDLVSGNGVYWGTEKMFQNPLMDLDGVKKAFDDASAK